MLGGYGRVDYFTLLVFDRGAHKWVPEFGDYSCAVVEQQQSDDFADDRCRIICTNDAQVHIDSEITSLNEIAANRKVDSRKAVRALRADQDRDACQNKESR